jgi:hypothetical protein
METKSVINNVVFSNLMSTSNLVFNPKLSLGIPLFLTDNSLIKQLGKKIGTKKEV